MTDKYITHTTNVYNPQRGGTFIQEIISSGASTITLTNQLSLMMNEENLLTTIKRIDGTTVSGQTYYKGIAYIYNDTTDEYITDHISSVANSTSNNNCVVTVSEGTTNGNSIEVGYYAISTGSDEDDVLMDPGASSSGAIYPRETMFESINKQMGNRCPINLPELGWKHSRLLIFKDFEAGDLATTPDTDLIVYDDSTKTCTHYNDKIDTNYPLIITAVRCIGVVGLYFKINMDGNANEYEENGDPWLYTSTSTLTNHIGYDGTSPLYEMLIRTGNRRTRAIKVEAYRDTGITGPGRVEISGWYHSTGGNL